MKDSTRVNSSNRLTVENEGRGSVERIYPVQYVRRFISWFKVLYNFRYTGGRRKPPPSPQACFIVFHEFPFYGLLT